jgi:O-antigen/teichoic acid export membrane protein
VRTKNLIDILRHRVAGQFTVDVVSTFVSQGIALLLTVVNAALIARSLGAEGKGTLELAILVPGMLSLLSNAGVNVANVYFAGSKQLSISDLTENSIFFALITSLVGVCIACIIVFTDIVQFLLPGVPLWAVLVAMLELPLLVLTSYLNAILQGLQRITIVNAVKVAQRLTILLLTALLVIGFQQGLLGALLGYLAGDLCALFILTLLIRKEGGSFTLRWNPSTLHKTLRFGVKGQIANVLQFFNYRLDTFILNYFLGASDVGLYNASVRFAELLWYLPNAVGFVIFPKASSTNAEEMNTFTPQVFRITVGLTALGALGLALLGKPLIRLVYSEAFASAYMPLLMLLPGVVLLGGAKVLANEIVGRGFPEYNSIGSGIGLVTTVVLDFLLVPRYGTKGAALATTIAYAAILCSSIFFYLQARRQSMVNTHKAPTERK